MQTRWIKATLVTLTSFLLTLVAATSIAQTAASSYSFKNIGTLRSDGSGDVFAWGINRLGQVAGYSYTDSGAYHAIFWDPRTGMTDLHHFVTTSGTNSYGYGINDNGQVVGEADMANNGFSHGFLATTPTLDVGTLGGGDSRANAVNNLGNIVGNAENAGNNWHAFHTSSDSPIGSPSTDDLGTLGGLWSGANAVNDANQVAGWSHTAKGPTHAFFWQSGVMTDLGTLGGPQSEGHGINASGNEVGWADTDLQNTMTGEWYCHAFLYTASSGMQDLGTLNGFPDSAADGVNASGVVVGYASTNHTSGRRRAIVWDSTNGMQDLNNLVPAGSGMVLEEATGINAKGQICGYGTIGGQRYAFVLSPPGIGSGTTGFDLNGDGRDDLLWQNAMSGGVYYWLMNGTSILSGNYLVAPNLISPEWWIVGTPDFNGDGHPDLLWQNQVTGDVYYWLMNGTTLLSGNYLARNINTNWKIVGTPDLNGDGHPDILWQNTANGAVYYWLMNGTTMVSGNFLLQPNVVDPSWKIVGTPDLNGDGQPDLLWENRNNGAVYYTYLNGTSLVAGGYLSQPNTIDLSWRIVGTPDLNGDGHADILWQNDIDGGVYYWLMDGISFLNGDYLVQPYTVDTSWKIVAPH